MQRAWVRGFAVSSNYAREHSQYVAAAASAGYITSLNPQGYSSQWNVTVLGLLYLEKQQ